MTETSGGALGLGEDVVDETAPDLDALLSDDSPEAPEAPPASTPEPEPVAAEAPEVAPEGEPTTEAEKEAEELFMGKYKTKEDWEEGHRNLEAWATKQSQERADALREAEQAKAQYQEFQQKIAPFIPHLEELARSGEFEAPPLDPQATQEQIEARANEIAQGRQVEQQKQAAGERYSAFVSQHPDAEVLAGDMLRIMKEYQASEPDYLPHNEGVIEASYELAKQPTLKSIIDELEMYPDMEAVKVAKELAAQPALLQVARINPRVVESDENMAWARQQAGLQPLVAQQEQAIHAQKSRDEAYVSTGGNSGATTHSAAKQALIDAFGEDITAPSTEPNNIFGLQ